MTVVPSGGSLPLILFLCCVDDLDSGRPGHHGWTGHTGAGGGWNRGGHRGVLSDLGGQHTLHDLGKGTEVGTGKQQPCHPAAAAGLTSHLQR